MRVLSDLEPLKVWEYFELLSSVPHGSGNTKAIADICQQFAIDHNLDYYRDEYNNIIIYKDASEGYKGDPLILQGHLDMVCVKEPESDKDLTNDPIDIRTDGEYVWADKTSLGADDVIAEAVTLAILEDDSLRHPPICAVFTADEETGMNGARMLDKSKVTGSRMINLDSEGEGYVTCGCAGGIRAVCSFPVIRESVGNDICYKINISGLLGGHSGREIAKSRANAIRLLARLIYGVSLKWNVRICSFSGGKFDNAIPTSAEAVVAVSREDAEDFEKLAGKHEKLFRYEYRNSDSDIHIDIQKTDQEELCIVRSLSKSLMRCLSSVPDGLRKMNEDLPDLPSISSNIGIARLADTDFRFVSLIRSNEPGQKEEVFKLISSMVEHDGGKVSIENEYPEWVFKKESKLRDLYISLGRKLFNTDIQITATHGGLEAGMFSSADPDLDIIAIGPELSDIHSTRERVEVSSVDRLYKLVREMISNM